MSKKHAIVLGAGAAGVLTARVLSRRFERVTIIERDLGPSNSEVRNGIPQAHHIHNVQLRGNQIIERLFPGFFGQVFDKAGAPTIELARDQRLLGPFGWNPSYKTNQYFRGYSRRLLDERLLTEVSRISNVKIEYGYEIRGLLYDQDKNQVMGITARSTKNRENIQNFSADLVVDCMGRSSRLPEWLKTNQIGAVRIKSAKMTDSYVSRFFKFHGSEPSWKQFAILRAPPVRDRGAYLLALEDNTWVVTLICDEKQELPSDEASFNAFAANLETSTVIDLIKQSTPQGPSRSFRSMECYCRFYDEMPNWPTGLLALGDSVCAFNPIYGQGITTAAVAVECLEDNLDSIETLGWEKNFHRKLIELMQNPWFYSVKDDLRPITRLAPITSFLKWYRNRSMRILFAALPKSPAIHRHLLHVQNLEKPISSLFSPLFVLKAYLIQKWAPKPAQPSDILAAPSKEMAA